MGIKVTPELARRYRDACAFCDRKRHAISGKYSLCNPLANGEFCEEIEEAEKIREEKGYGSAMKEFLMRLESYEGPISDFLTNRIHEFSEDELKTIFYGFEDIIDPLLHRYLKVREIKEQYGRVADRIRKVLEQKGLM